jgi:predicted ATPase
MNRTTQELLGELALVNQQVPMVTLDMLNNKLSADAQTAFGDRLVRLGEAFQQHATKEQVRVIDGEAQS